MRTRKRFGSTFSSPSGPTKSSTAIAPAPDDVFLEIGPGPGILTLRLAPKVSRLVAIEIDRDLIAELTPRLPAERVDRRWRCARYRSRRRAAAGAMHPFVSPAIFLTTSRRRFCFVCSSSSRGAGCRRDVDAAARGGRPHHARPGTAEYGVLSVLVQWRADVTRLLTIPPGAFRPPPDVRSALIRLAFRPPPFELQDPALFERMVRSMFTQRRKTLANALGPFADEIGTLRGRCWPPPASTPAEGPRRWRLLK